MIKNAIQYKIPHEMLNKRIRPHLMQALKIWRIGIFGDDHVFPDSVERSLK